MPVNSLVARCCALAVATAAVLPSAAAADFSPSESWTTSAFYGDLGTAFADATGDRKADAIAVNSTKITGRRANAASTAFDSATDWTSSAAYGDRGTRFGDVDGDGDADAVFVNNSGVAVRLSNGSSLGSASYWTTSGFYGSRDTYLADVSGDGRADVIAVNSDGILVRTSSGSSFNAAANWSNGAYYGDRDTAFADVTGDGRADAIAVNNDKIAVRASSGSAFAAAADWTGAGYYGDRSTAFADITGDGAADAIAVNNDKIAARASTGSSFAASTAWTSAAYYGDRSTHFADVNGDLVADAIVVNNDRLAVRLAPFADSFESADFPAHTWSDPLIDGNGSITRVAPSFGAPAGSHAMLAELTSTGTRAELMCYDDEYRCHGEHGSEYVYEFSFRVPSGYTLPSRATNIMQLKPSDVPTPSCYGGGLQIKQDPNNSGQIQISLETRWGTITSSGGFCDTTGKRSDVFAGTYSKDAWHRLKLHVKWNNSTDVNQGFVAAWLNGQNVVPMHDQRNLTDGSGRATWFRVGLYESLNNTNWRVYYDDVIVARR